MSVHGVEHPDSTDHANVFCHRTVGPADSDKADIVDKIFLDDKCILKKNYYIVSELLAKLQADGVLPGAELKITIEVIENKK